MSNVIKMDLYRLSRSKAVRVGVIVAAVVCFAATALSAGLLALVRWAMGVDATMGDSLLILEVALPFLGWYSGVDLAAVVMQFSGTLGMAIATVLAAIFVSEEHIAGYGKNYLGQLANRGVSAVSKVVATSIICAALILACTLSTSLAGLLFFGKYLTGLKAGHLALALALRLLMYLAINAIVVFICLLTKSKSAAMVIGVVFGIGASKIVYSSATFLMEFVVKQIFRVSDFTAPSIAGLIPDGVERMIDAELLTHVDLSLVVRVLLVAVVYIGGFTVASALLVRKRDVK